MAESHPQYCVFAQYAIASLCITLVRGTLQNVSRAFIFDNKERTS